jgi:hypothetical protein
MENIQRGKVASKAREPDQTVAADIARSAQIFADSDTELLNKVRATLTGFVRWLDSYGETSWDHQSFFAGPLGRCSKSIYYRNRLLGMAAVAPMIFCEAFLPTARRLFHHRIRFPIADAHYAMGFAFLYQANGEKKYFDSAVHFLEELKGSRSPNWAEYCWGYPFDWMTRGGVIKRDTPLITSTPYAYEAFLQLNSLQPRQEWEEILASIARHARFDIKDVVTSQNGSSCSYMPGEEYFVINTAAYRAFLLTSASQVFDNEDYWSVAQRNLHFVCEAQNPDGSWFYAIDDVRDFVDHYHTCFVMKALAKIHTLTGHELCYRALDKAVDYYLSNLFSPEGLPIPFSKAPRLTVYTRELYDCAECINLCLLLRDRFPQLQKTLETVTRDVIDNWIKVDGSFRSRRLHFGWDNVPMHRWGQSQMFRSLAFYLREARRVTSDECRVASVPFHQLSTLNSQPP